MTDFNYFKHKSVILKKPTFFSKCSNEEIKKNFDYTYKNLMKYFMPIDLELRFY